MGNLAIFNNDLKMSSIEVAELCGKRHNNVKRDIVTMLNELEIDVLNFEHNYYDANNREQIQYLLPKNLTLNLIGGYRSDLRLKIIDRWIELEEHTLASVPLGLPAMPELQVAECAARMLRMSETSKVRMLDSICETKGIDSRFLPSYSDENLTKALGDLLKENSSALSARAANVFLLELGIIEELERRSKKGGTKKFKSLTDLGLKFGKNETSKQNPNETQPRYYINRFNSLLDAINSYLTGDCIKPSIEPV